MDLQILYSVTGAADGAYANSLAVNGQGNLYGTTSNSAFELCQEPDGGVGSSATARVYPDVGTAYPGVNGPPVVDSAGNVYVTTGADENTDSAVLVSWFSHRTNG